MSDTERLPCKLTKVEIREQGERLAALRVEMNRIEVEKKSVMMTFKERLDDLGRECAQLTTNIHRREEWRVVEIREQRDFSVGMVRTIRLDTGEIVRSREMTDQERQRHIWDIPAVSEDAEDNYDQDEDTEDSDDKSVVEQVFDAAAEAINQGALDTPNAKVTATVKRGGKR